jgi:hypothetical protein
MQEVDRTSRILLSRRIVATLAVLLLVPTLIVLDVASVYANVRVVERRSAESSWFLPDSSGEHDRVAYRVWVRRLTPAGGAPITKVLLAKYKCDTDAEGFFCRVVTELDKEIPNDSFIFDDTLETASVEFRAHGEAHRASWTGVSDRGTSVEEGDCSQSEVGDNGRGIGRRAKGDATLFGERLKPRHHTDRVFSVPTRLKLMVAVKTC